ncbi:hypothetical protein BYT27DRAFT_7265802 [Phlegmacium glaucopus]|nr:hypothetical protein BYT27DRAFT_7265802 [Phlegmacium glaucopus]
MDIGLHLIIYNHIKLDHILQEQQELGVHTNIVGNRLVVESETLSFDDRIGTRYIVIVESLGLALYSM